MCDGPAARHVAPYRDHSWLAPSQMEYPVTKKHSATPPSLDSAHHADDAHLPAPHLNTPHPVVTSVAAEHLNDRMHLAAKPNDGEPLSHRNRGKAGRKG